MEIANLVVSIVSVVVSAAVSILVFVWTKNVSSSNYTIKERIVTDLLSLESQLTSICVKFSTAHLLNSKINIEEEKNYIKDFLTSPTMSFISAYDNAEENRLFYFNLLIISVDGDATSGISTLAKNALDMLHNICKSDIVKRIKKVTIIDCLSLVTDTKNQTNLLIQTCHNSVDKKKQNNDDVLYKKLMHIKNKDIKDPYIELFLLLMNGALKDEAMAESLINECGKMYGRLNVTTGEILEKYREYLEDFKAE